MILRKSYSSLLVVLLIQLEYIFSYKFENRQQRLNTYNNNNYAPENPSLSQLGLIQPYPTKKQAPYRKYGIEPTDRVLHVDQLTESDYEDIGQVEETETFTSEDKKYCARLFRHDLKKAFKIRRPRKDEEEDEEPEAAYLLSNYLDFDPVKAVSPLFAMMGSVAARNGTALEFNYKKLPPNLKTQISGLLDSLNQLITGQDSKKENEEEDE